MFCHCFWRGEILQLLTHRKYFFSCAFRFYISCSKKYAIERTSGKIQLDTDEVLYRVLCLPDDLHELHDDEEMLSQVRVFIKECSAEQIAEQIPRVLMDPVDRWLGDLMTLNIADGAGSCFANCGECLILLQVLTYSTRRHSCRHCLIGNLSLQT